LVLFLTGSKNRNSIPKLKKECKIQPHACRMHQVSGGQYASKIKNKVYEGAVAVRPVT
jgi:hypothetical protein